MSAPAAKKSTRAAATKKVATTPSKEVVAKKDSHKYKYAELSKASLTTSESHHIYGVVIDATFPYKTN